MIAPAVTDVVNGRKKIVRHTLLKLDALWMSSASPKPKSIERNMYCSVKEKVTFRDMRKYLLPSRYL